MEFTDKMNLIESVSTKASGEALISIQLDNIKKKWAELNFEIILYADYPNTYYMVGIDDILGNIYDH